MSSAVLTVMKSTIAIKEWLGHSDIETTANIYAHISHARKVSLAKSFGNTLKFTV